VQRDAKVKTDQSKELEALVAQKEQEIKHLRHEQAQAMHLSKAEFIQVQEQLKAEIASLKRERDSVELRLK
jgi:hypothetical protein